MDVIRRIKAGIKPALRGIFALSLIASVFWSSVSPATERSYTVDTSVSGATAVTGTESAQKAKGSARVLRSPELDVGPDEPELQPKQQVITKVTRPKIVRQLKFQRLQVNGFPVEPRVKFSRDIEVFDVDRIVDEEIRGDFLEQVTSDLAP